MDITSPHALKCHISGTFNQDQEYKTNLGMAFPQNY